MGAAPPVTDATPSAALLLATASRLWFEDLAERGIVVTDTELVVRAWNGWLVKQTGIAAEGAIGRSLLEVIPTIAARGLDEHYRRALLGEVRVLAHTFHKVLIPVIPAGANAAAGDVSQTARIAPLESEGQIIGTITVVEDVSERIVTERELRNQILVAERARITAEDASKLKDDFLATLSHEIRTPLNAVLGWARILRTQPQLKSRDHALEVIERNAGAQLRLVEDLLDMARVVSGKLRLDIKPVAMEQVVRAALDVVEPSAVAKRIAIRTHLDAPGVTVKADADRLQQAIWNVISNAVKFTPEEGCIDIRIAADRGVVELIVSDTGQGISAEFLPYVFDRFRQADASPSRRHGGLGLGLALARQILELHAGTISVESAGAGSGATFLVQLPRADDAVSVSALPHAAPSLAMLAGLVVLLVDDGADVREMLEVALHSYGADVIAVESAEIALTMLTNGRLLPDVLVSDIGLPGTDGYELIRRVRSSSPAIRHVPAIAITAYASAEDGIKALRAGFHVHLPKPVDSALLAESIKALVAAARP